MGKHPAGWWWRMVGPLVESRTYRRTLSALLDLPLGVAWFTIAVTGFSLGVGLVITLIGIPILIGLLYATRAMSSVERARARALLGVDVAPMAAQPGGLVWPRIKDPAGWTALLYAVLMLPWGVFAFTVTVVAWSVAVFGVTYPLFGWALHHDLVWLHGWTTVGTSVATFVVGLVFLLVTPRIMVGLAAVHASMVRGLLGRDPRDELERRVSALTESRDASVDAAANELQRIERDLHDGAQQRLVGLAMDLGLAKEKLAAGDDPEAAASLVTRAHDESKVAIAELRDLVRGIHPAVLTDRGLDAAISALVARCPVPVDLDVVLASRPAPAIEAAAYFVVAEALTNVAKHSAATRATVRVRERSGMLELEIGDDGVGGAAPAVRGGLAGLRDRVAAVEGRVRIASPLGGPTTIIVELPCAS